MRQREREQRRTAATKKWRKSAFFNPAGKKRKQCTKKPEMNQMKGNQGTLANNKQTPGKGCSILQRKYMANGGKMWRARARKDGRLKNTL